MKNVLFIAVFRKTPEPVSLLCAEEDISDFRWYKGTIREFLKFHCELIVKGAAPGEPSVITESVQGEPYNFNTYCRREGVAGVIVSRGNYPEQVAYGLLRKVLDDFLTKYPITSFSGVLEGKSFPMPELKEYIIKYQDPTEADSIAKIQYELGETKQILHKTIDQVLQRGEKIDSLVQKSDTLSAQSKMFYTSAKKQNSCCSIM